MRVAAAVGEAGTACKHGTHLGGRGRGKEGLSMTSVVVHVIPITV